MLRSIVFAVILASTGWAAYDLGQRASFAYERLMQVRVSAGLSAIGLDWADVSADGLILQIAGDAPDVFARELASDTAVAIAPLASVENQILAPDRKAPPLPPPQLVFHRDQESVVISGRHASEKDQERVVIDLGRALPDLTLHDLTEVGAADVDTSWREVVGLAIAAVSQVKNASVTATPGRVVAAGLAANLEEQRKIEGELAAVNKDRVLLDLALRVPSPVIAPFRFSLEKTLAGDTSLQACAAADNREAKVLTDLLQRDWRIADADCEIGLGRPDDRWTDAITVASQALARLPAGRLAIEYRTVGLELSAPMAEGDLELVLKRLIADLPAGYRAAGPTGSALAGLIKAEQAELPFWLRVRRGADGTILQGRVSGAPEQLALETYAAAMFGSADLETGLELANKQAPSGWQQTALAALTVLKDVPHATLDLTVNSLELDAVTESASDAVKIHHAFKEAMPDGVSVTTVISVDFPATYRMSELTADRCVVVLNRQASEAQIQFAAGSAVIERASTDALKALAETMNRCPKARFEIAGHTDSQGAEDFNLRLSQARADAVVGALIRSGVSHRRLVSRGYGETEPLTSNATPEGRAMNRRIAFRKAS